MTPPKTDVSANLIVRPGETVKTYYGEFKSWHPEPVRLIVEKVGGSDE